MLTSLNQMASISPMPNSVKPSEISKIEDTKPNSFSSNDSTHESNPKNQKFFFENNNQSYAVYLIFYEEKIKIKVNRVPEGRDEFFFEREISQDELMKINRVFRFCNNIEESFDYFNTLFSDKQNPLNIKEETDKLILNKKIKLSLPLMIEIPKKKFKNEIMNFIQNNNLINNNNLIIKNDLIQENKNKNDIDKSISLNIINFNEDEDNKDTENILPLNITDENKKNKLYNYLYNSKAENDILELPEEENDNNEIEEETSKKNLINNIPKTKSKNNINEEIKKNNSSLLNKKRISDSSDMSFNSVSNENEFGNYNSSNNINIINKKSKNNPAKESLLKLLSDNSSVKSGESEKFFVKIQKNLNLEKNKNKNSADLSLNQDKKNIDNKKEEDRSYLFGDEDSSEYIKDDIDLFSNKSNISPTITPTPVEVKNNNKINDLNESNFKLHIFNNNENNDYISKNFYEFKNCIQGVQNIQIKDSWKESNINYYNNKNNELKDSRKSKFYKPDKSYRIIHKNYIEYCTTEISYLFGEEMNKINNKSFSVDSSIISGYSEFDFIIHYLKKKINKEIIDSIRIYQATENGATAADFHRECDQNTNIIVLIKTNDGKKFGGYTSVGFSNFYRSYHDDTAFLFSIDKREIYPNIKGKSAVDSFYNFGPCFSGDSIKIYDNFLKNGGVTVKNSGNFETNEEFQINDGKMAFGVEEIEVLEFLERKNDEDNII